MWLRPARVQFVIHCMSLHVCSDFMPYCYMLTLDHTHTHTTVLWLSGFCPGQSGRAGTRRNIHPLTPIVVINRPLSSLSNTIHIFLPVQFTCLAVFFHNLSPGFLWSTSWTGTLNFILHTFLHPIIVFFPQHMPITIAACFANPSLSALYLELILVASRHTSI